MHAEALDPHTAPPPATWMSKQLSCPQETHIRTSPEIQILLTSPQMCRISQREGKQENVEGKKKIKVSKTLKIQRRNNF